MCKKVCCSSLTFANSLTQTSCVVVADAAVFVSLMAFYVGIWQIHHHLLDAITHKYTESLNSSRLRLTSRCCCRCDHFIFAHRQSIHDFSIALRCMSWKKTLFFCFWFSVRVCVYVCIAYAQCRYQMQFTDFTISTPFIFSFFRLFEHSLVRSFSHIFFSFFLCSFILSTNLFCQCHALLFFIPKMHFHIMYFIWLYAFVWLEVSRKTFSPMDMDVFQDSFYFQRQNHEIRFSSFSFRCWKRHRLLWNSTVSIFVITGCSMHHSFSFARSLSDSISMHFIRVFLCEMKEIKTASIFFVHEISEINFVLRFCSHRESRKVKQKNIHKNERNVKHKGEKNKFQLHLLLRPPLFFPFVSFWMSKKHIETNHDWINAKLAALVVINVEKEPKKTNERTKR